MSTTIPTINVNAANSTAEFFQSNSIIAKFAFLLMVIIAFVYLLRIGINAIAWFYSPNLSPHIFDGMIDATSGAMVIPQDTSNTDSITIFRSNNEKQGIEFTWSTWVFIRNMDYNKGQYKTIFYKGNSNLQSNGLNYPNNAPGLYIDPYKNDLVVVMDTYSVIGEEVVIQDVPMNKWMNVIIRCHNRNMDVYINGTITRSILLSDVPKQNYGEVYVATNGGFAGYISNLWYFNHALSAVEINNILYWGPNLTMAGNNPVTVKGSDYLSLQWYFSPSNIAPTSNFPHQ
jgi:hypothetical protein